MSNLTFLKSISERILPIRGERVILDSDLARFYGVATKRLNQQVQRNRSRFPADFLFLLTAEEKTEVVAKCNHLRKLKYSSVMPMAFTEHGALMAASILNSQRAIEASILVVRTFVELRKMLTETRELGERIRHIERDVLDHDSQITDIVEVLKQLSGPGGSKRPIGFR